MATLELPVYVKIQRGLHEVGTVTVDVEVTKEGRVIAPSQADFVEAFKNVEVSDG